MGRPLPSLPEPCEPAKSRLDLLNGGFFVCLKALLSTKLMPHIILAEQSPRGTTAPTTGFLNLFHLSLPSPKNRRAHR